MKFERRVGAHKIFLEVNTIGNDLLVTVFGGDKHHIGGVAIAYSTSSHYRDAQVTSMNTVTIPGHKDYIIANSSAEKICNTLRKNTVVVAGVHINNASRKEIEGVIKTVDSLVDDFLSSYQMAE